VTQRERAGEPAPAPPRSDRASWEFEPETAIAPGRTVLKSLGGGNLYEVFLVWDERLFSLAVAKVVRPDQVDDDHALRELRREIDTLARLAHPGIVRSFDAVVDGPHPHLLLEHLEGPSLRQLIGRHGRLPPDQLVPLALHVAGAIHYMAGEGFAHLDVKPDNIIMGVPPRLIDLSVASTSERAARFTGPVGTDAYMAPEQCDPEAYRGRIGPASDVWGLGATLFHAAYGEVPFPRLPDARHSEKPRERWPQLAEPPLPPSPPTPAALGEVILSTLRSDPDDRPTAAEFAEALGPIVAALPRRLVMGRGGLQAR
jgi:eukaryotic-like serine/threonine-protein kinase